jgi:hypothetical protein
MNASLSASRPKSFWIRTLTLVAFAALFESMCSRMYGQSSDTPETLQQALIHQFPLTTMTADRNDIVIAGAGLVLQKEGLMMCSTGSPMPALNIYKNGKISQGWGGLGQDYLLGKYPHQKFGKGVRFWVTAITVQRGGVAFTFYSDPIEQVRYYAQLKFPFEKGVFPGANQVLSTIAEVVTVQPPDSSTQISPSETSVKHVSASPVALNLPATYVSAATPTDRLQLNADNSVLLQEGGQTYHGTFTAGGNTVELNITETGYKTTVSIEGDNLTDNSGQKWVLQGQTTPNATPQELLRNQDIIDLAKAGLDDATILAKIENSACQFDTSTNALIKLKQSKVSAAVIKAIVAKPSLQ